MSGDEVEEVLAILLYNEHPGSVRIRPSKGDYGVDVLVPKANSDGVMDVYQIKKFALNLSASQKTQIKNSFKRCLVGLVRRKTLLGDWYLVTPLDPTPENYQWFDDLPAEAVKELFADVKVDLTPEEKQRINAWLKSAKRTWNGLPFCSKLAGKYWFVIDYYMHGGRDRVNSGMSDLAKILSTDMTLRGNESGSSADLQPAELAEHLGRVQSAISGDPHFKYGISLDPHLVPVTVEGGLVAATQRIEPDGSCITFRIYPRFAEALNERPIPLDLKFQFNAGSAEHAAFSDWLKFGKPLTSVASMEADFPGGLNGSIGVGLVAITPAEGAKTFLRRFRLRDDVEPIVAEVLCTMTSTSGLQSTGAWVTGLDSSGTLKIEMGIDVTSGPNQFKLSLEPDALIGKDPAEVLPALSFAAKCKAPRVVQIAEKYGPFSDVVKIPSSEDGVSGWVLEFVRELTIIQSRVSAPLQIPDPNSLTVDGLRDVAHAAALIEGKTIVGKWEGYEVDEPPMEAEEAYQIELTTPLTLRIGAQHLDLGFVKHTLLSATVTTGPNGPLLIPHGNDTEHQVFSPTPLEI